MKLLALTAVTCVVFAVTDHHWAWLGVVAVGAYAVWTLVPQRDELARYPFDRDLRR